MASQKPFFSVIIPTLNEEAYIGRLLEDLVLQKEKSLEVIVVDGGSKDATLSHVSHFMTKLPLALIQTKKSNVSLQRNLGADKASGAYLVFFDADVQIPPSFFLALKAKLVKKPTPFITTYVWADSKEVYDQIFAAGYNLVYELSILVERNLAPGFNFIVKKTVFNKTGGFREDAIHAEDFEYAMRLERHGFPLTVLRSPRLTFSLRRYRSSGHLNVLRKHIFAGFHLFTKGPITKDIFSYPMGGAWYRYAQKEVSHTKGLKKMQRYVKRFTKLLFE